MRYQRDVIRKFSHIVSDKNACETHEGVVLDQAIRAIKSLELACRLRLPHYSFESSGQHHNIEALGGPVGADNLRRMIKLAEEFFKTKKELLDSTPLEAPYDALYLCSAIVLPEHRGKGLAKSLIVEAIRSIRKRHPIKSLFYWAFSPEGRGLATSVAREAGLPLRERTDG